MAIIKRDTPADEVEGESDSASEADFIERSSAGLKSTNAARGPISQRLTPELRRGEAKPADRRAILADHLGEGDDARNVDKREAAILNGTIATSTIQALAELRRKADPKLTIEKARAEVRETHRELARREREARLETLSA